jgi:hypothetical protein
MKDTQSWVQENISFPESCFGLTYGRKRVATVQHTILSTQHNSILDIKSLILTQWQQPLFFCIILLELAADFDKS